MKPLVSRSLALLLANQTGSGAFLASPTFPTYRYSWFRDGSVCALALAEYGHAVDALRFFDWGATVILRYRAKIETSIDAAGRGTPPVAARCFHSRFTVEGGEVRGNWGHHQLDGLGTWLWALGSCLAAHPDVEVPGRLEQAAALARDYLTALWRYPCSDCWEENEEGIHTYTLATVTAGLRSYAARYRDQSAARTAVEVRSYLMTHCVSDGRFVKSVGGDDVDANLLGLCAPYGVVPWSDPRFQATLARIEATLLTPGLHRYRGDTYYGGGEWVLLNAWLGLVYASAGETARAQAQLAWVEAQASAEGHLPEQVPHALFAPAGHDEWVDRWGPGATPLLWSHAQYLLLVKALSREEEPA